MAKEEAKTARYVTTLHGNATYACLDCGSLVWDTDRHDTFHDGLWTHHIVWRALTKKAGAASSSPDAGSD